MKNTIGLVSKGAIEIVSGLHEGEQVILSDTSTIGDYKRVRLR